MTDIHTHIPVKRNKLCNEINCIHIGNITDKCRCSITITLFCSVITEFQISCHTIEIVMNITKKKTLIKNFFFLLELFYQ